MTKILVVEDMIDNRELLSDILQLHHYEVVEANDGRVALEIARLERPDLILMDVSLPHLDGFAVTRQMKADPYLANVPIIFVTAHAMGKEQKMASEAGGDGYITKPIDIYSLLEQVKFFLTKAT